MNRDQTTELLTYIAVHDQRNVTALEITAWRDALEDIPLDNDVKRAVVEFFKQAPEDPTAFHRIRPADVINGRQKIRNKRLENFNYIPSRPDMPIAEELEERRSQIEAIASGRVKAPERPAIAPVGMPPEVRARIARMARQNGGHDRLAGVEGMRSVGEILANLDRPGPDGE